METLKGSGPSTSTVANAPLKAARAAEDEEDVAFEVTGEVLYGSLLSLAKSCSMSRFGSFVYESLMSYIREHQESDRRLRSLFRLIDELEARCQLDLYRGSGPHERAAAAVLAAIQRQLSHLVRGKPAPVLVPRCRTMALQRVYQYKVNEQSLDLPSGECHKRGWFRFAACFMAAAATAAPAASWQGVFERLCKCKEFKRVAEELLPGGCEQVQQMGHTQLVQAVIEGMAVEVPVLSRREFGTAAAARLSPPRPRAASACNAASGANAASSAAAAAASAAGIAASRSVPFEMVEVRARCQREPSGSSYSTFGGSYEQEILDFEEGELNASFADLNVLAVAEKVEAEPGQEQQQQQQQVGGKACCSASAAATEASRANYQQMAGIAGGSAGAVTAMFAVRTQASDQDGVNGGGASGGGNGWGGCSDGACCLENWSYGNRATAVADDQTAAVVGQTDDELPSYMVSSSNSLQPQQQLSVGSSQEADDEASDDADDEDGRYYTSSSCGESSSEEEEQEQGWQQLQQQQQGDGASAEGIWHFKEPADAIEVLGDAEGIPLEVEAGSLQTQHLPQQQQQQQHFVAEVEAGICPNNSSGAHVGFSSSNAEAGSVDECSSGTTFGSTYDSRAAEMTCKSTGGNSNAATTAVICSGGGAEEATAGGGSIKADDTAADAAPAAAAAAGCFADEDDDSCELMYSARGGETFDDLEGLPASATAQFDAFAGFLDDADNFGANPSGAGGGGFGSSNSCPSDFEFGLGLGLDMGGIDDFEYSGGSGGCDSYCLPLGSMHLYHLSKSRPLRNSFLFPINEERP